MVDGFGLAGACALECANDEVQNVSPWPISTYGQRPTDFQQRYSWITPIAISQIDPSRCSRLAAASGVRTDQGMNWEALGPDLSAPQSCGA